MKIIASIGAGRFMVEATDEELAKVMGHGSTYNMKDTDKPAVGREIAVSPLWRALEVSRGRKKEITALANQMREVAARVDSINQALAEPIVEVKVA